MGGYPSVLVGSVLVCHFKINEQTYSRHRLRESTYHLGQKIVEAEAKQFLHWSSYRKRDLSLIVPENETQVLSGSSSAVVATDDEKPVITVAKSSPEKNETDERDWTMVSESNISLNIERETLDVIPDKSNDDKPFFDFFMPLNELIVIKKFKKNVRWKYVVIKLADGATLPPLHFHQGGRDKFLKALEIYLVTTPSLKNPYLINVSAHDESAMMRSFDNRLFKESSRSFPKRVVQSPMVTALSGFPR